MTSYTNAPPRSWHPRGASRPRHGLRIPHLTVLHLADAQPETSRRQWWTTRHPWRLLPM